MNIKGHTTSEQDLAAAILAPLTTPSDDFFCLGLQSKPGKGKTTGVVRTFPNVVVLDFDKKLPPGTASFPFWDHDWVLRTFPKERHMTAEGKEVVNVRDALLTFSRTQIKKLPPGGTLLVDSCTMVSMAFDRVSMAFPERYGDQSGFVMKYYSHKLTYSTEILQNFKSYRGHVVVTFHEQDERNKNGIVIGTKPLASGQMADKAGAFFTSFFRAEILTNPEDPLKPFFVWRVAPSDEFTAIRPPGFDMSKLPTFPNAENPKNPHKYYILQDFKELCRCCGK